MNKRQVGNRGEGLARIYLEEQGFVFLEKNVAYPCGEIDLVMLKEDVYYFIEVKYKRNLFYGTPREAMTKIKLKHFRKSVNQYVQGLNQSVNYKMAFVGILEIDHTITYDWIENILI